MKLLMIGMDGVCEETFNRGWTPFIKSLVEKGDTLTLKEDLISRGWSEIVTGKHAIETGALYEGPKGNGTLDWTEAFKISDVPGLGLDIKPIWQELNERGYRVGIMNVPTTFPAPDVDGFFVSGGGGGGPISQDAVPEQCCPTELSIRLKDMGYILDERRPTLLFEKGLYAPSDFFGRLKEMNEKRTQAFLELSQGYQVDFGFVVYKSSTVTAETMLPAELEKIDSKEGSVNYDFVAEAEGFYRDLDQRVKKLVEGFPEAEILLVSDHSMTINKFSVNANEFLSEIGLQVKNKGRRGLRDFVKSYKHLVPYSIKEKMKKSAKIKNAYQSMVTFDSKLTKAFSQSFSNGAHGIYVNDITRFGGPVPESEIETVAKEIVSEFNSHELARQHGIKARLKESVVSNVAYKFPDVILDAPDGYYTTNQYQNFIVASEPALDAINLYDVKKNQRTAIKGHVPLAVNVNKNWEGVSSGEDLTCIYRYILSRFS